MDYKVSEGSNLGKVDYTFSNLMHKSLRSEDGSVTLNKEEVEEVADELKKFLHLLSNSYLYETTLQKEAPGLYVELKKMEHQYRNYNGTSEEVKNVF